MAISRYEFRSEPSHKFWQIETKGKTNIVSYGRVGTTGQSQSKTHLTPKAARDAAAKLIAQKEKKGYTAVAAKKPKKATTKKSAKKAHDSKSLSFDDAVICKLSRIISPKLKSTLKKFSDFGYLDEDQIVLWWDGDVEVDDDLLLDFDQYRKSSLIQKNKVWSFIIGGNLLVGGSIVNQVGDFGISLIVLGDVNATNAVFGGTHGYIAGNLSLKNIGVAFYNHGYVVAAGSIKASALIYHDNAIGGKTGETPILEWGGVGRRSLKNAVMKKFIDDDYPMIDSIIKAVISGKPLLKPTPKAKKVVDVRELNLDGELAPPPNLKNYVNLECLKVRKSEFVLPPSVRKFKKLRKLYTDCGISEAQAKGISKMTQLEELHFGFGWLTPWSTMRKRGPIWAKGLRNLKHLHTANVSGKTLALLPGLESLHLDCGSTSLGKHPHLRKLIIENSRGEFKHLSHFPDLVELRLKNALHINATLSKSGFQKSKLKKVSLAYEYSCAHGAPGIVAAFFALPKLTHLSLKNTGLAVSDFKELGNSVLLRELTLDGVIPWGWEPKKLPQGILREVIKLPSLKVLRLNRCGLNKRQVTALRKSIPKCKILVDGKN